MTAGKHTSVPARRRVLFAGLIAPLIALGCGGDSTGPGDVDFPTVSASDMATYCIRGQAVPTASRTGSVSSTDCHSGVPDDGYWESWHVRVASTGSVDIEVDGTFDNYLEVISIADVNDIENTSTFIAEDDDSGPGLNAALSVSMQAGTDYAVIVSGYDDSSQGSYTLTMTQ